MDRRVSGRGVRRILFLSLLILPISGGCAFQGAETAKKEPPRRQTSGIVPVEGAELHYVIEGEGTPCIVLGHSGSARRILSQELRDHFRFVFVDLRHDARSRSSMEISKVTLDTYLDDIDQVRRALGLDVTAVFGHSIHSYLALEYARKYPTHTSHVIMSGVTPYRISGKAADEFWASDASAERKMVLERNWERMSEEEPGRRPSKDEVVRTYAAMTPKLLYDPNYDLSWIYEVVEPDRDLSNHLFQVIFKDYDIAKRPGKVETPIFLAIGRYDYLWPYFLWETRKEVLPNLSYNLFDKSGHFPMVEERALFDKKLIEWMAE